MSRSSNIVDGCPTPSALALDLLEGTGRHTGHRRRCAQCARVWQTLRQVASCLGATPGEVRAASDSCPAAAEWAALADAVVGDSRRGQLVEHLVACDACSALWQFLCGLPGADDRVAGEGNDGGPEPELVREPEGKDEVETGSLRRPSNRRAGRLGWMPRVAAVITTGGILAWLALPPPPVGPGGAERFRGAERTLVTEVVQAGPQAIVRWMDGPEVDGYRLRIWKADGELLVDRMLAADRRDWSGTLPDADQLYWQVEGWRQGSIVAYGPVSRLEAAPREGASGR